MTYLILFRAIGSSFFFFSFPFSLLHLSLTLTLLDLIDVIWDIVKKKIL